MNWSSLAEAAGARSRAGAGVISLGVLLLLGSPLRADDWPQWRGPQRDGVWRETGILESFPADGLKYRWRARISPGYSGPVVAAGRVYVTDRQRGPDVERVLCFAEETGKPLWVHSYPCDYEEMQYASGPRASPTVHQGKVYTLGARGHLFCLDAVKGEVLWQKDLAKDYQAQLRDYGISAAPLVEGERLIICAGCQPAASVIAFHKDTGKELWRALADRPAYSAPIAIDAGGKRQLIVWTADAVNSLDPATGKVWWTEPFKSNPNSGEVVASPVFHNNLLLCVKGWNRGAKMLKLAPEKPAVSILWETRNRPVTSISTPLFADDRHFYTVDKPEFSCNEVATGKTVWSTTAPMGPWAFAPSAHLTPNGRQIFLFNHRGKLILVRLTPEGYKEIGRTLLIEATSFIQYSEPVTWAHPAYANRHVFARNDKELVCASLAADQETSPLAVKPNAIHLRLRTSLPAQAYQQPEKIALSPDGKTLAWGRHDKTIKLWDMAMGKEQTRTGSKDRVAVVAFSPDGKRLASAGGHIETAEVKLWDLATGKEVANFEGHSNRVRTVAFSGDGKLLASGGHDTTVRVWDVATAKERALFDGHTDAVTSLAIAPDGQTLASGSQDRTVRLWDLATGKQRLVLTEGEDEILAVAFSPDGKLLASAGGDRAVRLWDVATAKERAILTGHKGIVYCLAFSPDGKLLASGSGDETVKLWDVATAEERATLRDFTSYVSSVAFTPDGKTLAAASGDDPVRLWQVGSDR